MRKWLDTVAALYETGQPVLYHGTTFVGLVAIFTENVLRGFPTDLRIAGRMVHDGPSSVSFTRDKREAFSHAGKDKNKPHGRVVLVFDRDRLARRFGRKLRPIDVLQIRGRLPNEPYTGVSEYEERIPGDITNVVSFIVGILVPDQDAFASFEQMTVAHDPRLQSIFTLIHARMGT
jgi:hypothetical protein